MNFISKIHGSFACFSKHLKNNFSFFFLQPKTNIEEAPNTSDKPTESSTDLTELRKRLERIKKKAI